MVPGCLQMYGNSPASPSLVQRLKVFTTTPGSCTDHCYPPPTCPSSPRPEVPHPSPSSVCPPDPIHLFPLPSRVCRSPTHLLASVSPSLTLSLLSPKAHVQLNPQEPGSYPPPLLLRLPFEGKSDGFRGIQSLLIPLYLTLLLQPRDLRTFLFWLPTHPEVLLEV